MGKVELSILRRAALALPLCLAACGGGAAGGGAAQSVQATSVEVTDLAGLEAALEAHRGQGLLLNFWAIWCAPCVAELPDLAEVAREAAPRGGRVLTVSYDLMVAVDDPDSVPETVRAFLDQRGLALPALVFDEADYDGINERFGLPGEIPVTLAFDRAGALVDRQEGKAGKARFEEMMRAALGE